MDGQAGHLLDVLDPVLQVEDNPEVCRHLGLLESGRWSMRKHSPTLAPAWEVRA